jgi:hypothetical protein
MVFVPLRDVVRPTEVCGGDLHDGTAVCIRERRGRREEGRLVRLGEDMIEGKRREGEDR